MKLGLSTYDLPRDAPKTLPSGVIKLPDRQRRAVVNVINIETGEVVDNVVALAWGLGTSFAGAIEAPGLFTTEHFEEDKDYVLIAFACEYMTEFDRPPEGET